MIYSVINPSDAMTIEADDDLIAAIAGLNLGEGRIGIDDENGKTVLPILTFGGDRAFLSWLQTVGIDSVEDLRPICVERKDEIAACLESIVYGSVTDRKGFIVTTESMEHHDRLIAAEKWNDIHRSSMSNYSKSAFALAKAMRELTLEEDVASE